MLAHVKSFVTRKGTVKPPPTVTIVVKRYGKKPAVIVGNRKTKEAKVAIRLSTAFWMTTMTRVFHDQKVRLLVDCAQGGRVQEWP